LFGGRRGRVRSGVWGRGRRGGRGGRGRRVFCFHLRVLIRGTDTSRRISRRISRGIVRGIIRGIVRKFFWDFGDLLKDTDKESSRILVVREKTHRSLEVHPFRFFWRRGKDGGRIGFAMVLGEIIESLAPFPGFILNFPL